MDETYDRHHVEMVLKRAGMPDEERNSLLDGLRFPIGLAELQGFLAPLGITHDGLINRMGGSP